ncbi:MAG: hypothetical protein ABIJ61_12630 [bacterium]
MISATESEELIAKYGKLRRIRYLISSAVEFKETTGSTSKVLGHAASREDLVALQKLAKFYVMPLSSSPSNFVACFDVPKSMLGERNGDAYERPDYAAQPIAASDFTFLQKESLTSCSYRVGCLWEINVALADFDRRLRSILTESNGRRLRDSLVINVKPANEEGQKHLVNFILPDLDQGQVEKLHAALAPATEAVLG